MNFLSVFIVLLCMANADENLVSQVESFRKMTVKALRKYLFDRGLECKACSEKEEFVKMAYDNREKPIQQNEPKKAEEV